MKDIIKAILRSIGIKLEDVRTERIVMDYGSGGVIPTNDWIMVFEYKNYKKYKIAIELNKVGTKESWISLVRYYDGDMIDLHRVEVIDTTPQELYEIINDFIHKIV